MARNVWYPGMLPNANNTATGNNATAYANPLMSPFWTSGNTTIPNTFSYTPWIGNLSTTANAYTSGFGSNVASGFMNFLQPNIGNFTGALTSILSGNAAPGYVSSTIQNMLAGGGLSPDYVSAMRDLVLKPQQQSLQGQLNQMGGGVAAPESGLFQYLQAENERKFNEQLMGLGMQNYMGALNLGANVQNQYANQWQNLLGQYMSPYTALAGTALSGDTGLAQEQYRTQTLADILKYQQLGSALSSIMFGTPVGQSGSSLASILIGSLGKLIGLGGGNNTPQAPAPGQEEGPGIWDIVKSIGTASIPNLWDILLGNSTGGNVGTGGGGGIGWPGNVDLSNFMSTFPYQSSYGLNMNPFDLLGFPLGNPFNPNWG